MYNTIQKSVKDDKPIQFSVLYNTNALVMITEIQGTCDEKNHTDIDKRLILPTGIVDKLVNSMSENMKQNLMNYWSDSESGSRGRPGV